MGLSPIHLAVDAGGTKTHFALELPDGQLFFAKAGPANPQNTSFKQAFSLIFQSAFQLIKSHQLQDSPITRICIGMAGLDTQDEFDQIKKVLNQLSAPFSFQEVIIVNDGYIGLLSGSDELYGICLIAGTGANCYGVSPTGKVWSAGDWGYLLGDQHSGYALGLIIVQQVMKEYDGRQPQSLLTQYVLNKYDLSSPSQIVQYIYQHPNPIATIASLSLVLADPELHSHPIIQSGLQSTIDAIEQSYQAVTTHLNFSSLDSFPAVLSGGLFNQEVIRTSTQKIIRKITPKAEIIIPQKKPVYGALKIVKTKAASRNVPDLSLIIRS